MGLLWKSRCAAMIPKRDGFGVLAGRPGPDPEGDSAPARNDRCAPRQVVMTPRVLIIPWN